MSFELNPPQTGRSRSPFIRVTLNGNNLPGVISADVTNNSHFIADTYRLCVALSALPAGMDAAYFSESTGDKIGITFAFHDKESKQPDLLAMVGLVDDVEVDLIGRCLTLSGRDLSAQMRDTKTSDHFQQKTSSEIATIIAGRHGLTPNIAKTMTRVGRYYELYQSSLTVSQPEWDMLTFLAEREGFDLWVSGTTLNFQPSVVETDPPYVLLWSDQGQGNRSSNTVDLKLRRSQTLAMDIIVKVRTFNQAQGVSFTVQAKRTSTKTQGSSGTAQEYNFTIPNLTKDQAQQIANTRLEQLTRHERVISASLPGDNLLTIRKPIKLVGTGTSWDQIYYVDSIERHISASQGYRMELRAKNHSTGSTVSE